MTDLKLLIIERILSKDYSSDKKEVLIETITLMPDKDLKTMLNEKDYIPKDIRNKNTTGRRITMSLLFGTFYMLSQLSKKEIKECVDKGNMITGIGFEKGRARSQIYHKCREDLAKRMAGKVKQFASKCKDTDNPEKCKAQVDKYYERWNKEAERFNKYYTKRSLGYKL